MKLGIIGNGFVGKATKMLECKEITIISYDLNPHLCDPQGTTIEDVALCDIIFISVPTPMNKDGSCHLNIVEGVVEKLRTIGCKKPLVLRSTVPPGTSERLGCSFMPEFLTEANAVFDFINNKEWIFGIDDDSVKPLLQNMITTAFSYNRITYNKITFLTTKESEMVKMFRNNFLTVKVSLCNELYNWCRAKDIDYDRVRTVAFSDSRIGLSHTKVPGPDGKYGFGGTCFPKDINSAISDMISVSTYPVILKAANTRNNKLDRSSRDWEKNKGRSVI